MAVSKTLMFFFAVVAVAVAEEDKRDVLLGAYPYAAVPGYGVPYASPAVAPGYVAAPAPGYVATPAAGYVAAPAAVPYISRPAGYVASPAYVAPSYAAGPAVAYAGVPAYDDGKYYPGKYEKSKFYNVPRVVV